MGIPNQQWTYVIVGLTDVTVVGTDDEKIAKEFNHSEDHIVINIKTAQILGGNHEPMNIPEQQDYKL